MDIINNSDGFFREIRSIEVYPANMINFVSVLKGENPNLGVLARFMNIVPEDFSRSIKLKYNNDNEYFDIELTFALYTADLGLPKHYQSIFGKRKFAVKLISNSDQLLLGNDREPLTIDFQDALKDDGSGTDKYEISIYGTTIIDPRMSLIKL